MPWKDDSPCARLQLVRALALEGNLSAVCRSFGLSRRTAYRWLARYHAEGLAGLQPRSHRPKRVPQKYRSLWSERVLALRRRHRTWGASKLRSRLLHLYPRARRWPARRTIDRWLRAARLSAKAPPRKRPGPIIVRAPLTAATAPNHVWTIDFKGWFRTGDGARCDLLTVRDLASRFVLAVRLVKKLDDQRTRLAMTAIFRRYGLPQIIRVDNGSPFAGLGSRNLSRLSVWWLRLGIQVEFTRRAKPQDNGAHEQMHRILKAETASPPAPSLHAQQRRSERWVRLYNEMRPHQALGGQVPARLYRPSPRPFRQPKPSTYPGAWLIRRVRRNGWIKLHGRLRFIGRAFVHQWIGLHTLNAEVCEIYLDHLLLGTLHQGDGTGSLRPCAYAPPTHPQPNV
jgi:transposase InsO family protein